jgi:hypothetical protein
MTNGALAGMPGGPFDGDDVGVVVGRPRHDVVARAGARRGRVKNCRNRLPHFDNPADVEGLVGAGRRPAATGCHFVPLGAVARRRARMSAGHGLR